MKNDNKNEDINVEKIQKSERWVEFGCSWDGMNLAPDRKVGRKLQFFGNFKDILDC